MKIILFSIISLALISSCNKSGLNDPNPNMPTPEASLTTEGGLMAFGAGIMERAIYSLPVQGKSNILCVAMEQQAIEGDEQFCAIGNFGLRYVDQVYSITIPGAGTIINPVGKTQQQQLQSSNSRSAADQNAFQYEWTVDYFFIKQANAIITALKNPALSFTNGEMIKRATLAAWAYWWKGYSYSRLGSTYLSGIIANSDGTLNSNFIDHAVIITEANQDFDSCIAQLNTIDASSILPNASDAYSTTMLQLVLSFNDNTDIVTPAMWQRQINTYKARNILANKKLPNMQTADWQQIISLCQNGLKASDFYFKFGMNAVNTNQDLSFGYAHPLILLGPLSARLTYLSERLVQDFKPGDARFTKNVEQLPYPPAKDNIYLLSAFTNQLGRGYQFGTRWTAIPVERGGAWATNANEGFVPFATTYEENQLMLAEAYINTSQVDFGLSYIDQVRDYQNAQLPHVSGTGLSLDSAKEELRRERRIALCQRGLAFFDARRQGITKPVEDGGGRSNAIVYLPASIIGAVHDTAVACLMNYNYMDYWDVPQNELDFNVPATGSVAVKN